MTAGRTAASKTNRRIRNGRTNREKQDAKEQAATYPLLTGGGLPQVPVNASWSAGPCRGSPGMRVFHGLMGHLFVQALDDHHAAGGLLELGEADDNAEADHERQDEHGARRQALHDAERPVAESPAPHAPRPAAAGFGAATVVVHQARDALLPSPAVRPCAAAALRSAADLGRAPRRSCLARSAATSTNRNRLWMGARGSGGISGSSRRFHGFAHVHDGNRA